LKISKADFDLIHTFECGQCFRWNQSQDGSYIGVIKGQVILIKQQKDNFVAYCKNEDALKEYLDLNRDYSKLKSIISSLDDILPRAVESGYGIRILKQDPWETLVSFIISSNNNIPRIKKIIEKLCQEYGNKIDYNGERYYSFPSADIISKLSLEDIDIIKSGFRGKYILDAANKVNSGEIDLDIVYNLDTPTAREYLKQIKGVGNKVADCILLFAYQKFDVFPKDVWIKKVLNELYAVDEKDFDVFVQEHFGDVAGFAQQYLFYYMRGKQL